MSFQVTYNAGFEPESYELFAFEPGQSYDFRSPLSSIKIRILSDSSLAFKRKTSAMEITGILHLNRLTRLKVKVLEYETPVTLDAVMTKMTIDFPREISFRYQIVNDGMNVDEPLDVLIEEKI